MKIYKIILPILFALMFMGCEEIIEVELDNAESQIVIEANISDDPNYNVVRITESTDFYNPSQYESVSGAEVTVNDENGNSFIFSESEPGVYINTNIDPQIGMEYSISVIANNKTYSASSMMQQPLILDSISVEKDNRPFQDEFDYDYHAYFQDNPGVEDFARFRLLINDKLQVGIFRYDDRLTDGNYIDFDRFFFEERDEILPGDVITIEMITIDKLTFEYFDTLRRVIASSRGPFGSTAPSNPVTNWNNDALGYFSASSIQSKSITIE